MIAHKPSKWWPLSFLIVSIVLAAIGGGLFGGATANIVQNCYNNTDANGNVSNVCVASNSNSGMFYAGVAFLGLCGITHFIFWIVLIVWLVKRHNYYKYSEQTVIYNQTGAPPQDDKMPVHQVQHV